MHRRAGRSTLRCGGAVLLRRSMETSKRPWQGAQTGGPPMKRGGGAGGGSGSGAIDDDMVEAQFAAEPEGMDVDDEDQHLQMADIDVDLGEAGRNWERPAPPPLDPRADSISADTPRLPMVRQCSNRSWHGQLHCTLWTQFRPC